MAHGQPDFGIYAPKKTVFGQSDLGELGVRLGSIVSFDRRGDVIYLDNFEGGIERYEEGGAGTGNAVAWSAANWRSAGFCMKMTAGSTTSTPHASVNWAIPAPVKSKVGFEFSFSFEDDWDYLELRIILEDGTDMGYFWVRYDRANHKVQYYDDAMTWQDVSSVTPLYESYRAFHTLKLVVDYENWEFDRLILNDDTLDLSSYSPYLSTPPARTRMDMGIRLIGRSGYNDTCYIDDIIVTQNEP